MKFIFIFSFFNLITAQTRWETAVSANQDWKYIIPTEQPSINWNQIVFNDQNWGIAQGGFGYGDSDDGTIIPTGTLSIFLRKTFLITEAINLSNALLHSDYDDGFIAYLNGIEIARSQNMGEIGYFTNFDEGTNGADHEAQLYQGLIPEYTLIDSSLLSEIIIDGENLLAIQINNIEESSSDMSSNFYLSFEMKDEFTYFNSTPDWFIIPISYNNSNLPMVVINTNGQTIVDDPRIDAYMGIINNSNGFNNVNDLFNDYEGNITIELRGNSSQYNPKKPYRIETVDIEGENDNVSLLGMPEENDWVLYAPYQDKTLMRNVLAYQLSNEMGRYASKTRFCELYINDDYKGVYVLMEKIKRDGSRINISKLESDEINGDDVTGGYILKFDWYNTGDNNGGFQSQNDGMIYNYHYPKPSDIVPEQEEYIISYIDDFEEIMLSDNYTDIENGYPSITDVESFIDFIILQEFSKNVDAYRLSTYIYKDKESVNNKLFAGPIWDLNHGFGNCDYGETWLTDGWLLDYNPEGGDQMTFWWELLWADPNFKDRVSDRYTSLRQNILSDINIFTKIDSIQGYLGQSVQRNFNRWQILGSYVWPNFYVFDTYNEEVDYLKIWIQNRLIWMDNQILLNSDKDLVSRSFKLENPYPNPFNPELNINFSIKKRNNVKLEIFNLKGELVTELFKGFIDSGSHDFNWRTENIPSGIYFVHLNGINESISKKVVLLK